VSWPARGGAGNATGAISPSPVHRFCPHRDTPRMVKRVLVAAMGVEGLVVKGAATRYTPGRATPG